jgi:hypothetical protein
MTGSYTYVDKPSDILKVGMFLDSLSDCYLLKWDSAM